MLPDSKALVMPNYASESAEAVDLASLPGPRWARGGRTVPSQPQTPWQPRAALIVQRSAWTSWVILPDEWTGAHSADAGLSSRPLPASKRLGGARQSGRGPGRPSR